MGNFLPVFVQLFTSVALLCAVLVVFELHPIGFFIFLDNSEVRICPLFLVTVLAVPGSLVSILCISAFKSLMSQAQTRLLWTCTQYPLQFCSDHGSLSSFVSAPQKLCKSRPPAQGLYAQRCGASQTCAKPQSALTYLHEWFL